MRRKLGLPQAFYPLLEGQEKPMEIWIGDAVNLCKKCDDPAIYDIRIAVVVDIVSETEIAVRQSGLIRKVKVSKVRFDSRIMDKNHTFKRLPLKF